MLRCFGLMVAGAALVLHKVRALSPVSDTGIDGTWSTGTGAVETGQKYFNIVNDTFIVPPLAGQSYSFLPDSDTTGYWEQLVYKYNTSGMFGALTDSEDSRPGCYEAMLYWQHGNYTINANNSITLTPFGPDGRQQVSRPCDTSTNYVGYYYQ